MRFKKHAFAITLAFAVLSTGLQQNTHACSRVVHKSTYGNYVVTGRNMDWSEDTESDLWFFPRGKERSGEEWGGQEMHNPLTWKAKYGSVIASTWKKGTVDGLNEMGLAANTLYLEGTDYGHGIDARPEVSWLMYAQYLLDNFATVKEAVKELEKMRFRVVATPFPGKSGTPPTLHFSISDAKGDSAIIEYINGGELSITHGKEYTVMTNSPSYKKQLKINECWELLEEKDGKELLSGISNSVDRLPGTSSSIDRFIRASYYSAHMPEPITSRQAIVNIMSVMRNVSQPSGQDYPTRWRSIADSKNKIYYFDSLLSFNTIWVNLKELDFSKDYMVLRLTDKDKLVGDVSKQFKKVTDPTKFGFTANQLGQ
jgi:penicillin V acylase-like amidase (Ntn superfamily)